MFEGVIADRGGMAAGRDLTITGIPPEQLRDAMLAVLREESLSARQAEELRERLNRLSTELNVRVSAVETFFRILGEQELSLDKLPEKLAEIASRHLSMLERLAVLTQDDPAAQVLMEEAKSFIEEGDYDHADSLLDEVETIELAAMRMANELARQAHEAADRCGLKASETLHLRGELSMTRLNYIQAAERFKAASELVPPTKLEIRIHYLNHYTDALSRYGSNNGDVAALNKAIQCCRQTLLEIPRDMMPLEWASMQDEMGYALENLGAMSDPMLLDEAVQAFRAALEERTRERVPLDWAATQCHLAYTLAIIGQRESGTLRLEEAVQAFRAVLVVHTREHAPVEWAKTKYFLAAVLRVLGERESGTEHLEESVTSCQEALKELTHQLQPEQWANVQAEMGETLLVLGLREFGTERFKEGQLACREALKERTRERAPWKWAFTQTTLGINLTLLGEREANQGLLRDAVAALHEAVQEFKRESALVNWAYSQIQLAKALRLLGEIESGTERLEEAVTACQEALKELTRDHYPVYWAETKCTRNRSSSSWGA